MNIKPDWIGITEQQFNIFKIIYELNIKKINSKAKDIIIEYENHSHSTIKRQNLFSQLKVLIERGLIKRDSKFSYIISQDNIENILYTNKELKRKELEEFNKFLKDFKKEFNSLLHIPKVFYLDNTTYMETISNLINRSSIMYADSPFPNISYRQSFYKLLNRKDFIESMKINCFKLKKLKIYYLTSLVIDLTFRRCLRIFKSPIRAYKECTNAIDRLEKEVRLFPNLEVRYMEVLPGPHMYVFENNEPNNVILSLRGSNVPKGIKEVKGSQDPYGGVHIISPQIAKAAKNIFLSSFEQAIPLKGKKGDLLFEQARINLDKLYQNL